jgi:hypothetical protein
MKQVRDKGRVRFVAALSVTAGLALFGLSAAPTALADTAPIGQLTLSITSTLGGTTTTVTLTCEPTGGDHPDADAACADLIAANGNIEDIPPVPAQCPAFNPVEFDASGTWAGQPVTYGMKNNQRCVLEAATGGHVFNF